MQRFEIGVEDTDSGRISILRTPDKSPTEEDTVAPRIEEKERGESDKAGDEDV